MDWKTLITTYGGCDYVTGEASFDEEACDQGRLTGARGCRFDFLADGGRICSRLCRQRTCSRRLTLHRIWRSCSAKKKSQMSAWRRSMSSTMRTLAAAYRWRGVAVAVAAAAAVAVAPAAEPAEAVAAPAAAALPADLAALPGASAACAEWAAWLPATLTSEYQDGRVRQGRPGRSMSASARPHADAAVMASRFPNPFKKCQRTIWT